MDLPFRHPTERSYQIYRTPYFRQLHRKDPDQLDRLKQAYENVHNFDEKPIEAQIKKLRLGKLLRRIRQSLTSSKLIRPDKEHQSPQSTAEQIRAGQLAKARQLGIDYCRQNLDIPTPLLSFLDNQKHRRIQQQLREKSRLDRRLEYGNSESQKNRKSHPHRDKIQCSHTLNEEGYVGRRTTSVHKYSELDSSSMTEQGLRNLQRSQSREDFIKFLANCLSTDNLNPNILKAFEDILRSKNDLYSDLQSAINQRLKFIEHYKGFIEKLSNLATNTVPKATLQEVIDGSFESFNSKTNIMPRSKSPEVYIRTYRYSEEDDFLPPPSESLLRIPDYIDNEELSENVPAPPPLPKRRSSHLSTKFKSNLPTDPAIKMSLTQKFGDIIRDTVRQESVVILADLAKAIKH